MPTREYQIEFKQSLEHGGHAIGENETIQPYGR